MGIPWTISFTITPAAQRTVPRNRMPQASSQLLRPLPFFQEDMVVMDKPDARSVVTYVTQIYRALK